jgi:uncharacterized membrane protein (UPF0127 family)
MRASRPEYAMTHFLEPLLRRHSGPARLIDATTGTVIASDITTAFDSASRRQGLLGCEAWAAGQALVLAPCAAVHTCFMRFPIDVVFVDRGGRVRKIAEHLRAWRIAASPRAFAAIEMAAGSAAAAGVQLGARLAIAAQPPREVTVASGQLSGSGQTL